MMREHSILNEACRARLFYQEVAPIRLTGNLAPLECQVIAPKFRRQVRDFARTPVNWHLKKFHIPATSKKILYRLRLQTPCLEARDVDLKGDDCIGPPQKAFSAGERAELVTLDIRLDEIHSVQAAFIGVFVERSDFAAR
jgi:hypothetical protein